MTFNDQGEVLGANGDAVIRDENVLEDVATVQRIAKAAEPLQTIHEKIVAQAASEIVGARAECRAGECTTMFFLISDAMFDSVKDQGVQIAIQNSGGIRASLDAGKVIMGEVLTVLPFQNTLSTFEVSGAILLAALKNGVNQVEEGAGRFLQVAGLRFTFNPKAEVGQWAADAQVLKSGHFDPLDLSKLYSVVSNNYVRNGCDGCKMFKVATNFYDYGPDLADVVAEYMATYPAYKPYLAGRIAERLRRWQIPSRL